MEDCLTKEFQKEIRYINTIQTGIELRFNHFKNFDYILQSGQIILKSLAKSLIPNSQNSEIEELKQFIEYFEDQDNDQEQVPKKNQDDTNDIIQKNIYQEENNISPLYFIKNINPQENLQQNNNENEQQKEQDQDEDDDEFENIVEPEQEDLNLVPKFLYDCLLGLRSDNRSRIEHCLKHLPFLVRNNLDDLDLLWKELAQTLLGIFFDDIQIEKGDELRDKCLQSLIILKPRQMSKFICDRIFQQGTGLGEKHSLVKVIGQSVQELADNPKKYLKESFNSYSESVDKDFYFMKISSTYYKPQQINKAKAQMQEEKTRRWGQTRIEFEKNNKGDNLRKIRQQDLQIVKFDKNQAFINVYNEMVDSFVYPLLIPIRKNQKSFFQKHTNLLTQIAILIIVLLENGQNSIKFYNVLEEALDFLIEFNGIREINFQRQKLQCLMKISLLIKKDILFSYPLIVQKLSTLVQSLANLKGENDPINKQIIQIIISNIQTLFDFDQIKL